LHSEPSALYPVQIESANADVMKMDLSGGRLKIRSSNAKIRSSFPDDLVEACGGTETLKINAALFQVLCHNL
jgi:hypothetical protein